MAAKCYHAWCDVPRLALHHMDGCLGACTVLGPDTGSWERRGLNSTNISLLLLGIVGAIGAGALSDGSGAHGFRV